jgi:hypothetical protein
MVLKKTKNVNFVKSKIIKFDHRLREFNLTHMQLCWGDEFVFILTLKQKPNNFRSKI